jgi:transcription elongation factor SPT6
MKSDHIHYVKDQELSPTVFAEQFVDPDPSKALPAEELLRRARMILATELGKDPLLRNQMRKIFQEEALISIEPTERGMAKIDDQHLYFVRRALLPMSSILILASQNFKYLHNKPIQKMLESTQFLHILAAEADHLVTVSIHIPSDVKSAFERRLNDAFASDSFADAARHWNEERSRVVQDVLEQHLIPAGIKSTREYLREEVEDYLAGQCGAHLRKVSYYCKCRILYSDRCL